MASVLEFPEKYFRFENDISAKPIVGHRHYHNAFEIYYLEAGECKYFIDSRSYDVRAGDLILIPEGVIHHTAYSEGIHSRKLIYCSSALIPSAAADMLPSLLYLYRNDAVLPQIRAIFSDIEKEYTYPDGYSNSVIKAKLELLFLLLARNKNLCSDKGGGNDYVRAAVEYIRDSFGTDISLSQVAKHISVSPEHLSRLFKKETGFGFCEYITLVRLKKAEELLSEKPELSVSAVAYACGFNDSNYFCERFKHSYGISPLKYKKTEQATHLLSKGGQE